MPDTHGVKADGGGLRFDDGKARFDLMPPEALWALADLYRVGSAKYDERNWERGMSWMKCFGCLMRHSWKWMLGEEFDPETGSHHMIHAAWNAIAIFTYFTRQIGTDDRHKVAKPEKRPCAERFCNECLAPGHCLKNDECLRRAGGCWDNRFFSHGLSRSPTSSSA